MNVDDPDTVSEPVIVVLPVISTVLVPQVKVSVVPSKPINFLSL